MYILLRNASIKANDSVSLAPEIKVLSLKPKMQGHGTLILTAITTIPKTNFCHNAKIAHSRFTILEMTFLGSFEPLIVLLIGQGGREAALAWKISQSPRATKVYCAPGNGGTAKGLTKVENVDIAESEFQKLASFAVDHGVNLAVPGSEVPLVEGIEAIFRRVGIRCFGPTKEAARMEGSKTFAKDFMNR